MSSVVSHTPDKPAELLNREDALARQVATLPPSRRRDEFNRELADIRRLLEQLGYRRSASSRSPRNEQVTR